ncbi:MAG: cation transporter [Actinomycetota bacterium]|nr:cation transporter [Actinomycetota bacterium]
MSVQTAHHQAVQVTGMTCQHCVNAVTDELSALDGVRAVDVTLSSGLVTLSSTRELSNAEIAAAIDEAGFSVAD